MPMDMRLMIPRRRRLSSSMLGGILGTGDGAALGTDAGVGFQVAAPILSLTYRTGSGFASPGEISDDLNSPQNFSIGYPDDNAVAFIGSLASDTVSPGSNGSLVEFSDGTTTYQCRIGGVVGPLDPGFAGNIYLYTWLYNNEIGRAHV